MADLTKDQRLIQLARDAEPLLDALMDEITDFDPEAECSQAHLDAYSWLCRFNVITLDEQTPDPD